MATRGNTATQQGPQGRVIGTIGPRPHPTAVPAHSHPWNERGPDWFPRVDVVRRRDALVVTADLEGLSREDISVKISREHLVIERIQRPSADDTSEGYQPARRGAPFKRTIVLPDDADTPKAGARLTGGVLEIRIPLSTAGPSRPLALG